MKRMLTATVLAATAMIALPPTAHAGVGFTAHQTFEGGTRGLTQSSTQIYPSLDIVFDGNVVQLSAFELLDGISTKRVWLGGTYYTTVMKGKIKQDFNGVIQAGGGIDIMSGVDYNFDALDLQLTGEMRMGAQKAKDIGFGIYVVPKFGFGYSAGTDANGDGSTGDLELVLGGGIQISTWINN